MKLTFWRRHAAPTPPITKHRVETECPEIAAELRADGARVELERIQGVYHACSFTKLPPLIERLMFDGRTPKEGAALANVALWQADAAIAVEALRGRDAVPSLARH